MVEKKNLPVEAVIEKIGAGNTYFLLGESLKQETEERFTFDGWCSVFSFAYYAKDEEVKSKALDKMREKAATFSELACLYFSEKDEEKAAVVFKHLLKIGTSEDWLNRYANKLYHAFTIKTRTDLFEARAEEIIKAVIVQ
ncbi:MAG: hypothetical protein US57_C0007G0022 [Candidatus Moranbacteria bacterium GW2011_GWC2_37_73]|nr:MAG: hypothetical protein UR95_C0004G0061 [Parcubacteria group bacterium GW2011_GWC1_36_108]KKQ00596.1 MAG: hypothetical protein US09_C0009G0017 [Candidatus Moranbacteria bacterium GW2011_GWD1_36_198]KKQ02021.1 MAG: hypothetical protein US10_C0006G0019 [Candidatus Moranbacteria bacterium GW2011_GWD2_36_198]KKQ39878.1 MAG: hypothetical protein US57_C0007G0022 [Candidatus Moranbacteria bacterium GW2011_GWC2_37_73]HAS00206.1 hypothetical protein [Candidatus Moranbacteria bacterium]